MSTKRYGLIAIFILGVTSLGYSQIAAETNRSDGNSKAEVQTTESLKPTLSPNDQLVVKKAIFNEPAEAAQDRLQNQSLQNQSPNQQTSLKSERLISRLDSTGNDATHLADLKLRTTGLLKSNNERDNERQRQRSNAHQLSSDRAIWEAYGQTTVPFQAKLSRAYGVSPMNRDLFYISEKPSVNELDQFQSQNYIQLRSIPINRRLPENLIGSLITLPVQTLQLLDLGKLMSERDRP